MAQSVFRANQVVKKEGEVLLKLTKEFKIEEEVEEEPEEEYTGPTADDLRKEAEAFKRNWEVQKSYLISQAQSQADGIVNKAKDDAFQEVKKQTDQAAIIKEEAQKQADEIISKANEEAKKMIAEAGATQQQIRDSAQDEGFKKGHEDGYKDGYEEAQRLIERLHRMIEGVQNRRQDILDNTEQQIVDLVLLMTRKVVKIMSDNQKSVIMANVVSALKKVKGRGDVTLRVNMADAKMTTEHIKDFIKEVENIKNINVVEDSSVEKGGCIVETDFGAIDARIASQLGELETKILEISPIKSVNKVDVPNPDM